MWAKMPRYGHIVSSLIAPVGSEFDCLCRTSILDSDSRPGSSGFGYVTVTVTVTRGLILHTRISGMGLFYIRVNEKALVTVTHSINNDLRSSWLRQS
jgi:hypothetical protein